MSYKVGDISNPQDPSLGMDASDITKALNILNGKEPFPAQGSLLYDLLNVNQDWSFTGISFREICKSYQVVYNGEPTADYNEPWFDFQNGNKGSQIAGHNDEFAASLPTTADYGSWPGEAKEVGWAKVYEKSGQFQEASDVRPSLPMLKTKTFTFLEFGLRSMSLSGDILAIPVWYNDTHAAVLLYERWEDEFVFKHELSVEDSSRPPIVEVNTDGDVDWLFVGNPIASKVLVYDLAEIKANFNRRGSNTTAPRVVLESTTSDPTSPTFYGSSLHCSGSLLFVGNENGRVLASAGMVGCGYVDVYELITTSTPTWEKTTRMTPWDVDSYQVPGSYGVEPVDIKFGYSVYHKGDLVVIGAPNAYTTNHLRREGAIYVFTLLSNSSWTYEYKIEYDDSFVGNLDSINEVGSFELGRSVVFDDNYAIWTALNPLHGSHVARYTKSSTTWISDEITKIAEQRVGGVLFTNGADVVFGGPNQIRVFTTDAIQTLDEPESSSSQTEKPKRPLPITPEKPPPDADKPPSDADKPPSDADKPSSVADKPKQIIQKSSVDKPSHNNIESHATPPTPRPLITMQVESSNGDDCVELATSHGVLIVNTTEPLQYKSNPNSKVKCVARPTSDAREVTWLIDEEVVGSDTSYELSVATDNVKLIAKFTDSEFTNEISPPPPEPLSKLLLSSTYEAAICVVTVNGKSKFFKGEQIVDVQTDSEVSFSSISDEYYDFVGLTGDTKWLLNRTGKMPNRDVEISFDFKEVVVDTSSYEPNALDDATTEPMLHITVQASDTKLDSDGVKQLKLVKDTLLSYYNNDESLYNQRVTILNEDVVSQSLSVSEQIPNKLSNTSDAWLLESEPSKITEKEILPVALIEAGSSYRMFSELITNKSHPIENLGNGEYRIYFNELVADGRVRKSSPAYFAAPKSASNPLEYRSVSVGYNSDALIQNIEKVRHDYTEVKIVTAWSTGDNILNLVTNRPHGLIEGEFVTIRNSSHDGVLNGSHEVIPNSDSIFSIKFENNDMSDFSGLSAVFESLYGSKIYCNVTDFSVNDMIIFDYAGGKGASHMILDISKDEHGVYFLVGGLVSVFAKKAVRSHSQTNDEDLVEFGYENHLSYYQVTKLNTQEDSLWLAYEPDVTTSGRAGNMVSYIQFFHKDMSVYG